VDRSPPPEGAQVVDLGGRSVIPGLIDVHAHLHYGVSDAQPEHSWRHEINLAYGVTTTRDPQTSSTDVLTYGDLVEAGRMVGPRIYSTGPGVFGDYVEDPIRDLDHARDILKR